MEKSFRNMFHASSVSSNAQIPEFVNCLPVQLMAQISVIELEHRKCCIDSDYPKIAAGVLGRAASSSEIAEPKKTQC